MLDYDEDLFEACRACEGQGRLPFTMLSPDHVLTRKCLVCKGSGKFRFGEDDYADEDNEN